MMKRLVRGFAAVPVVIAYSAASLVITLCSVHADRRRRRLLRNSSFFSTLTLALLGVRAATQGRKRLVHGSGGRLIVSNHLSYLDILILSSIMPSVFITSVELKNTPFLGMLARFGGSIFVERRSPSGLKDEIEMISQALRKGFAVVLFPEGTTTNGECVRPFKSSLLTAAVRAGADILPVCLRYKSVNGKKLGSDDRDLVFYYGGMSFFRHLLRLLTLNSVEAELTLLEPIPARPHHSRKQLAALAHKTVSAAYLR